MLINELQKQYEQVKKHRPNEVELIKAYEMVLNDITPKLRPSSNASSRFVYGL
jgi:hypothetical protein